MSKRTTPTKRKAAPPKQRVGFVGSTRKVIDDFLARRPHRSFRRTYRRDYLRPFTIQGYWGFTIHVWRVICSNRNLFLSVAIGYGVFMALFVGLASQDTYTQISDIIDEAGPEFFTDGLSSFGQAGILVLSGISGSFSSALTESQQVYSAIILLMTWLTTVWLLRAVMSGAKPRLRDGLYNAGAPIVSTGIVLLILLLQLVPAALGVLIVNAAIGTELFRVGIIAMLISGIAVLMVVLSLYWTVSTFIALVVVTLPGMYPWQAIRTAGDLVIGRRRSILLRLIWMLLHNGLIWTAAVFMAVIIDRWVDTASWLTWLPLVPVTIAIAGSVVIVYSAAYVYMLYRKVVDDDAQPA